MTYKIDIADEKESRKDDAWLQRRQAEQRQRQAEQRRQQQRRALAEAQRQPLQAEEQRQPKAAEQQPRVEEPQSTANDEFRKELETVVGRGPRTEERKEKKAAPELTERQKKTQGTLLAAIDAHLGKLMGKHSTDKDLYQQKTAVLKAARNVLNGEHKVSELNKVIEENPRYNEATFRSKVEKLVTDVRVFASEFASVPSPGPGSRRG